MTLQKEQQYKKLMRNLKEQETLLHTIWEEERASGATYSLYDKTLEYESKAETYALNARELIYMLPNIRRGIEPVEAIIKNIPLEIGYTSQGWFSVRLPGLLPKKDRGSVRYVRGFLQPAMERFFLGREPYIYPSKCVIIYRHVYGAGFPKTKKRDHDNIEINQVTDIMRSYATHDDSPEWLNHYYMSADGTECRTEVYIVPECEFALFLVAEKNMPKEGVELYDDRA